jgi:hypothetical protein
MKDAGYLLVALVTMLVLILLLYTTAGSGVGLASVLCWLELACSS